MWKVFTSTAAFRLVEKRERERRRDVVARSHSFSSPAARAPRRARSQAIKFFAQLLKALNYVFSQYSGLLFKIAPSLWLGCGKGDFFL